MFAERGYDAEQVDREIAAERARERALGLDFRRPGSPAQGVQAVGADGLSAQSSSADGTDASDSTERPSPAEEEP